MKAQRNADGSVAQVWEKWLAFSPDPQYLTIYARYDPGMVVRRHGHFSPHVVFVLEGEVSFGDRRCPAGTHIELPLGAAFGPVVAGPEGAVMFEVMMGDPRSWGDEPEAYEAALAAQGAEAAARSAARVPRLARRPPRALGRSRQAGTEVYVSPADADCLRRRREDVRVTRNRFAGEPFDDSDEVIAGALAEVSVPALLCSLVHMTGDPSWVRGDIQPNVGMSLDIQGAMSEEDMAEVRRRALPAIAAYRDGGCVPVDLSRDVLQEMMSFLGRRPVEGRLAGLLLRRSAVRGWGQRRDHVGRRESPEAQKAESPVVVIGCGMGGILAGIRLQQAGLPFTIIDKNGGPGGTWWENRYPGARVDVGSHQYCYLLRAGRVLERVLLPTAGALRVLRRRSSTSTTCGRTAASRRP